MDHDHTSYELLAHFDPHDEVVAAPKTRSVAAHRVRDARWVIKWAAAFAILVIAGATLLEFTYLMAAERTLNFAVRAGAMEATLPRATYDSVRTTIERRLAGCSQMQSQLQMMLLCDGHPVGKRLAASDGARYSVVVKTPAAAALPSWLIKLTTWHSEQPLTAHAERTVPGRQLRQPRL